MDLLAHTLWTAAGVAAWSRRRAVTAPAAVATVSMAALPDVAQMLPVVLWWLAGDGTFAAVQSYAVATPGHEPALPAAVQVVSHHLHCAMHSAPLAALVSMAAWVMTRRLWLALVGWWAHIVVDVFTHSAEYYAVPVLYPFTTRGFDGMAWNTPWFMVLNYLALSIAGLWLMTGRKGRH